VIIAGVVTGIIYGMFEVLLERQLWRGLLNLFFLRETVIAWFWGALARGIVMGKGSWGWGAGS
jgi:hypothetical protein